MNTHSSSFEINESSAWGRFVAATRDFGIGDVILDEAPLLITPTILKSTHPDQGGGYVFIKKCVGCYKLLNKIPSSCCRCRWPVCGWKCQNEPFHKRYECDVFRRNRISPSDNVAVKLTNIVRGCMMYKENPQNWQQFTMLSSQWDELTDDLKSDIEQKVSDTTKWINDVCKLEVDEIIIGVIIRTLILNGFTTGGKDKKGYWYEAEFLYKSGCLFPHSYSPNADWRILQTNQNGVKRWNLRIYAKRNIRCNEPINIPYLIDHLNEDTATRKKILAKHFQFNCQCDRWAHPSKFNFFTAALKWTTCGNKHLLPDNPSSAISTWTCANCGNCSDFSEIKGYFDYYENNLQSVTEDHLPGEWEPCFDKLITSSDERHLSSNHRLLIRTMNYWLKLQKFMDLLEHTIGSQMKFIKILERAKSCLKMSRTFGTLRYIVTTELVFAYAIAAFYFKTETLCSIEYNDYSPEEKRQIVCAIYSHMKIAVEIIKRSPFHTDYNLFRDVAFLRFKFWSKQFKALKYVQTVDAKSADRKISSNASQGNRARKACQEVKTCLWLVWTRVCKYLLRKTASKVSEGHSRRFASRIEISPNVSLLLRYDFY